MHSMKGDCIKRYHFQCFGSLLKGSNIGLSGNLEQREASSLRYLQTNVPVSPLGSFCSQEALL